MQGWIKLHRRLKTHWLYNQKPKSKLEAWIDMLFMANHAGKQFMLGNELVEVERGSFITSEVKLMEEWGWSKSKVRSFLDLLQKDSMIVKKTDHKKTAVTIVRYEFYQSEATTEEPQKDRKKTAKRPQKDTNKNVKNEKNEKNELDYIVDSFNSICTSLPKVKQLTDKRKRSIKARFKKFSVDQLQTAFQKAEASDFLSGRNGKWTSCNFDWIMNETNLVKVLEGNYDNKKAEKPSDNHEASETEKMWLGVD